MPATNKPVDVYAVDVLRFENGKVVEYWGYMEEMKMMEQLGMMPGAEDPAKK
jgi:predicted ester cyclase